MGSDQTSGKRAGGVHYETERGRAAPTLYTRRQVSVMVSRYAALVPPLGLCIGPTREAGLSTGT